MALQISDVIIPTFTGEEIQAHIATAELLLKRLKHPDRNMENICVPVELLVRGSTKERTAK